MKLSRNDLRKIMYDFNSLSNRLLQADFEDYNGVLEKFVRFINETEIIHDYIVDCGECNQDLEAEFKEVQSHNAIFSLGDTDEEEVRTVFAILNYIVEHDVNVYYGIGMSYSHSNKFQDIIKDFNDRVTMVLIRHIETYLTKVGIDMGVDDKIVYNITVRDGQVNIANDNATITASNVVNTVDAQELARLIRDVRSKAEGGLTDEEKETLDSSLEVIEQETKVKKPRKSFIKTAVTGLKAIKGTAEFAAAVVTLIQFLEPLLS
jgi:hypothetical protein